MLVRANLPRASEEITTHLRFKQCNIDLGPRSTYSAAGGDLVDPLCSIKFCCY